MTLYRDPREDDIQEQYLAHRRIERDERREERRAARVMLARDVAAYLAMYLLALALIGTVLVAWFATGDERFGWAFLLMGGGIVVAYMSGVRGTR